MISYGYPPFPAYSALNLKKADVIRGSPPSPRLTKFGLRFGRFQKDGVSRNRRKEEYLFHITYIRLIVYPIKLILFKKSIFQVLRENTAKGSRLYMLLSMAHTYRSIHKPSFNIFDCIRLSITNDFSVSFKNLFNAITMEEKSGNVIHYENSSYLFIEANLLSSMD